MPIETNEGVGPIVGLPGSLPEELMKAISGQELLHDFETLSERDKREVLSFVAKLKGSKLPKGTPGKKLLKFAGLFDAESIKQMEEAIEEGCEQVSSHGW